MRLLIAEDDKALAQFLSRGLEADGYRVRLAFDGGAAVEAFRQEMPDLTILDLNMPVNGVLSYPNFGYIEYNNAVANGHYNGLEASLTRRFSHGLQFRLAWTWSRSIDDAPEELVGNDAYAQNGYGPQWTGPSDFDTPQRVALSYVYELPAGRGHNLFSHGLASYILGNWRTSGVYTYSSGLPFTVWSGSALTTALDPNGASDPVNTAVPNVIGKAHIVGDVNCWFYASQNSVCDALAPNVTDAFQLQQSGQFGSGDSPVTPVRYYWILPPRMNICVERS